MKKKKWILLTSLLFIIFVIFIVIMFFYIPVEGLWVPVSKTISPRVNSIYFKFENGKIDEYVLKSVFNEYIENGQAVSQSTGEISLTVLPAVARYEREGINQYKITNIDNNVGRIKVGFFSLEIVYDKFPQTIYKLERLCDPFKIYSIKHRAEKPEQKQSKHLQPRNL